MGLMNQNIVNVSIDQFLTYRETYDNEFFTRAVTSDKLALLMEVGSGIVMRAEVSKNDSRFLAIRKYANVPNPKHLLMLETHNFAKPETWADSSSAFVIEPYEGYKLHIMSVIVRFPINVVLDTTPLSFTVNKYVPEYGSVVPAIQQTYNSLQELIVGSNSPWHSVDFSGTNITQGQMIEIKFRYADDDFSNFSKLTLSSKLGESIVCDIGGPLKDGSNNDLVDPAYAIFNTKRVIEY